MTSKAVVGWMIALGIAFGLVGCKSAGTAVVVGTSKVMVKAAQPPAPRPVVKPRPRPRKAKLVDKKIEITEKVMFEYNKAVIRPESHSLLKDVAEVMKKNSQVKKLRVEGHTDSDGTAAKNRVLSQRRAEAVRKFLISLGLAEGRLVAKGYGEDKPIADNKTDEGKEKNRRVEFNVIEQ